MAYDPFARYSALEPAGLEASPARFARHQSRSKARWLLHRVASAMPGPIVSVWLLFLWIPWFGLALRRWAITRRQLRQGSLTPVLVLDAARGLCAAYSDLAIAEEDRAPVVKVWAERLELVPGVKDGQRLAAASFFELPDRPDATEWPDVRPIVVDCLCDDAAGCAEALARIPAEAWSALEAALAALGPAGREPGLHRLHAGDDPGAARRA